MITKSNYLLSLCREAAIFENRAVHSRFPYFCLFTEGTTSLSTEKNPVAHQISLCTIAAANSMRTDPTLPYYYALLCINPFAT